MKMAKIKPLTLDEHLTLAGMIERIDDGLDTLEWTGVVVEKYDQAHLREARRSLALLRERLDQLFATCPDRLRDHESSPYHGDYGDITYDGCPTPKAFWYAQIEPQLKRIPDYLFGHTHAMVSDLFLHRVRNHLVVMRWILFGDSEEPGPNDGHWP